MYRVLAGVEHGTPPDDTAIRDWMGADKREALAALTGETDVEELHTASVTRLRATYDATPPVPSAGVPEALAALRAAGVAVVLTTGSTGR